jgi:hypothetical protein
MSISWSIGATTYRYLKCIAYDKLLKTPTIILNNPVYQRCWAILKSIKRKHLNVPPPTRHLPRPSGRCRCHHALYVLRHRTVTYPALTQRPKRTLLRHTEIIYPAPTESRTRTPLHDTEALAPWQSPFRQNQAEPAMFVKRRMQLDRCHLTF